MSSIKQYQDKSVIVKYHPDEKVIHLQLKPKASKDALGKVEDKLKTTLTVDSTDSPRPTERLLTLGAQTQEASVHEFLQTFLQGGKETGDAVDSEGPDSEVQPPIPAQPGMMPGGAPPTSPGQLPMENFNIADVYIMMMENVKVPRYTRVLKEATYRTGEHWDILSQASGKGKQQIDDRDVLSLRRTYTKKRKSVQRDKVLRALDRVSRYFIRKLRNVVGQEAAQMFKQKYKKIGQLTPMDYAEPQPGESPLGQDMSMDQPEHQPAFDPQSIDFSEFFPKDKSEEEEYPEEESEDEEETPEEKYGGAEEEDYPD